MSREPTQHGRHIPDDATLSSERHPSAHRDGRLERRRRNRQAVLDAYLELTSQGNPDPTMEQLAELAGVSHRSVFRYFDDRPALMVAAADHLVDLLARDLFVPHEPTAPLDDRIDRFVSARVTGHERHGATASRMMSRLDDVKPGSADHIRARLRGDLHGHFKAEIDSQGVDHLLDLVATPFQFEAIHLLSSAVSHDAEALRSLLRAHLGLMLRSVD